MSKLENLPVNTESDIKNTQIATGELKKSKPRGRPFQKGNKFGSISKKNREKLSLAEYIKRKTDDGKMLTDLYIGILKVVEKSDPDNIPMYKGMKVTAELAHKAVEWLGKNGWGTPSQRIPEPEVDDRTEEQKLTELEYTLKELSPVETIKNVALHMGYEMVPITQ
jgi:hypothetical protein